MNAKRLMTEMIHYMNQVPELEIETIVNNVENDDGRNESFLNHIYQEDNKIVFVIINYISKDGE